MNNSLNISNISFKYPNRNDLILNDISFTISNEIAGILAPTGAGKTTLLNIIAGLLQPSNGFVTISGVKSYEACLNKKVGFSFQDSTLIDWKSVLDNVLLPLKIGKEKKVDIKLINKALGLISMVGLEKYRNYKCEELSGGMKQRIGLARALVTDPDLIIFDEPFNKLDFITKSELLIEFRRILKLQKVNSLIVTHDIEDALFISDKILVFSDQPLSLLKTIEVEFDNRDEDLLQDQMFIESVSKIKKFILK